uniref:Uncharacterized protein n=1 Tax=Coccidioides posadasii RMSCC 3488 TaxID=454284 RepID=A0A0J6I5S2_COCPO|nr:hypothetical protein CPAG_03085 [Coccidioides posadasii RMSCC 3488]
MAQGRLCQKFALYSYLIEWLLMVVMLSQEAHLGRPASGWCLRIIPIFDITEMYCFRLSKLLKLLGLINFPTIRTRDAHQFEDDEEIYKDLNKITTKSSR